MKHLSFLFVFCLLLPARFLQAQEMQELMADPVARSLYELPDVIFTKIKKNGDYPGEVYELRIRQPIDHEDESKGYFYQRAFLTHVDFEAPMVICTEGYMRPANRMYELTLALEANQVDVEHRYFGASKPHHAEPETKEYWKYLTLEQQTADLHHIREVLGQIYRGDWISTGISKGGQTTIFYRYFYPDDVTASVAYVAPLNLSEEDPRIYAFFDTIGSEECRQKIYAYQKYMLKHRDEALARLKWYAKGGGNEFTYLTLEQAFEYAVLEYPFSLWQMGFGCEAVPELKKASMDDLTAHLMEVADLSFWDDEHLHLFGPHYYQAATQMGYYGYETEDFRGLLKALPMHPHPNAAFVPYKLDVPRDYSLPNKVYKWLQENGNRFIYIYGEIDTWSATGVPPSDKVDALWITVKGADHGRARIRYMSPEQRKKVFGALRRWMEGE